ncbi:MAG: DNA-binding response OmpR family regulator/two-component sensor histidine kinase [Phenylobacterium sp.]
MLLSKKHDEFANMSHEFRTPLTLVLGPVMQLLGTELSDITRQKLTVVKRNGYRLLRMVDQLLHMEKFRVQQTSHANSYTITVALQPLISQMAQSFQTLIEQKQITLTIDCPEAIYLAFTPDALEKILLNLISNALKYTPQGGKVLIGAEVVNRKVKIAVSDNGIGIGIAPEQQSLVFERFHRVLDQQSEHVTGAGIGLALVKALVEAHQGEIILTSEEQVGTTMTVILPVIDKPPMTDSASSPVEGKQALIDVEIEGFSEQLPSELHGINDDEGSLVDGLVDNRPTLLIVEDNSDMRQYIVQSLSGRYRCLLEPDGRAGLQRAIAEVPDIIISDVMMPQMNGLELTKAVKSDDRTSHIPVILLTAKDDRQSRLQGWYEKADEYLTKPFDPQELHVRIDNLLAIRDILRHRFNQSVFAMPQTSEQIILKVAEKAKPTAETLKLEAQTVFLDKLNDVIHHLYPSQETTIPQIASQAAMSERQLFRKLKGTLGINPTEYLRRFRLEKACGLLNEGMNSSTVALEVGFSTHSYFTRCFSAQYACAPSEYGGA